LSEGGRIISIGSIAGDTSPFPGIADYSATKAAVAAYTRGWARDLGPKGITVNNVQPGPIDTDMNPANGEFAEMQRAGTALGRYGKPEEVAASGRFPRQARGWLYHWDHAQRGWRVQRLMKLSNWPSTKPPRGLSKGSERVWQSEEKTLMLADIHRDSAHRMPLNQGHSYDNDRPITLDQRKSYYAKLGCIDVPIPPEWMTQEMTYDRCKGHVGYLASMQFLAQRQDLKTFPAVGYWMCAARIPSVWRRWNVVFPVAVQTRATRSSFVP
jgi:hypothetical protein